MNASPLLALACFALVGCPGPNLDTDPLVIAGTGETEFLALGAGVTELPMVSGVQGGTHVWGAVRATGMDWTELLVTWTLSDEDGDLVTEPTSIRQSLQSCAVTEAGCERGMGEVVAVTLVLDEPSAVRGDELTLHLLATDNEGRSAEVEAQVRPVVVIEL